MEPCPQKAQHPPRSVERPLSSVGDGDDLHVSVLVAPQYPPKNPSINQACGYVQPSSKEVLMWSKCIMKTGDKVQNQNTTYKVSHVNTKTIR
jgi:hypothetical protein